MIQGNKYLEIYRNLARSTSFFKLHIFILFPCWFLLSKVHRLLLAAVNDLSADDGGSLPSNKKLQEMCKHMNKKHRVRRRSPHCDRNSQLKYTSTCCFFTGSMKNASLYIGGFLHLPLFFFSFQGKNFQEKKRV